MRTVFTYELESGETFHSDPLAVRRILLERTDGRAWTYINDLNTIRSDIAEIQQKEQDEQTKAQLAIASVGVAKLEGLLAQATMDALGYSPIDPVTGEGMTEFAALELLAKFMEFAEGKE